MIILRNFLTLITFLAACNFATADTLKDPAEARLLSDKVMQLVGKGEVADGLLLIKSYLIIPVAEFDLTLSQMKAQQPLVEQRFGKSIGQEFLREDKVGENLIRFRYLHRFEKHIMQWNFYFYKTPKGWVLNTYKSDDDLKSLFN